MQATNDRTKRIKYDLRGKKIHLDELSDKQLWIAYQKQIKEAANQGEVMLEADRLQQRALRMAEHICKEADKRGMQIHEKVDI